MIKALPHDATRAAAEKREGYIPHVAIFGGDALGAAGGMGQIMAPMLRAALERLGASSVVLAPDGQRVSDINGWQGVLGRVPRLRQRAIRLAHQRAGLPVLHWLSGRFDVYHYIGLSLRPRGAYGRLVISIYDLGGERWRDEMPYPSWSRDVLRRAARLITISEFSKQELSSYYNLDPERITVITLGCDHTTFRPDPAANDAASLAWALGDQAHVPYLLCAGGQTERKNVARLLEAYATYRANGGSRTLVITGVDPRGVAGMRYIALARRLAIEQVALLPGYLPAAIMPALYRHADAIVVPSLYEGFGLPVLQGMASGTPVLASNASSLPEVGGDAALYVDACSADALAAGLARITADNGLRAHLRRKGLSRASQFTWDRCADQLVEIYRAVACSKGAFDQ